MVEETKTTTAARPHTFQWQQTMLRIKDPKVSVPFYVNHFGFTLLETIDFPDMKFTLNFLAILPEGETAPAPGTPEAHDYLFNFKGVTLELTYNYGTDT